MIFFRGVHTSAIFDDIFIEFSFNNNSFQRSLMFDFKFKRFSSLHFPKCTLHMKLSSPDSPEVLRRAIRVWLLIVIPLSHPLSLKFFVSGCLSLYRMINLFRSHLLQPPSRPLRRGNYLPATTHISPIKIHLLDARLVLISFSRLTCIRFWLSVFFSPSPSSRANQFVCNCYHTLFRKRYTTVNIFTFHIILIHSAPSKALTTPVSENFEDVSIFKLSFQIL